MSAERGHVAGLQVWQGNDEIVGVGDVVVRFLGARHGHVPSWGEVRAASTTISWGPGGAGATSVVPRGPDRACLWGLPLSDLEAVVFAAPDCNAAIARATRACRAWFPRRKPDPDDVEPVDAMWLELGVAEGDPQVRGYGLTFARHVLEWIGPPIAALRVVRHPPPRFPPDGSSPPPAFAAAGVVASRRRPVLARGTDLPRPTHRPRRETGDPFRNDSTTRGPRSS